MTTHQGAFASILNQKCPQCRREKVFAHPTYSTKFLTMHRYCPHCNMDLEPEPGFYWGAMYITYGFNTGLAITVSIALYFFFGNPNMWTYVAIIGGLSILLAPAFFRYSRVLFLYALGGKRFNPELHKA